MLDLELELNQLKTDLKDVKQRIASIPIASLELPQLRRKKGQLESEITYMQSKLRSSKSRERER